MVIPPELHEQILSASNVDELTTYDQLWAACEYRKFTFGDIERQICKLSCEEVFTDEQTVALLARCLTMRDWATNYQQAVETFEA